MIGFGKRISVPRGPLNRAPVEGFVEKVYGVELDRALRDKVASAIEEHPDAAPVLAKGAGLFVTRGLDRDSQEIPNLLAPGEFAKIGSTVTGDSNDLKAIAPGVKSVAIHGGIGNYVSGDSEVFSATSAFMEFTVRVYIDSDPGVTVNIMGTSSSRRAFRLLSNDRLTIFSLNENAQNLGAAQSDAIPNVRRRWVWLRGYLDRVSARCTYHYSHQMTSNPDLVQWIPAGSYAGGNSGTEFRFPEASRILGTNTSGVAPIGLMYFGYAEWRFEGVDLRFDFTNSSTGLPPGASLSRSSGGYKSNLVDAESILLQSDGVDDFVVLPASCMPTVTPTAGSYTSLTTLRKHSGGATGAIFAAGQNLYRGVAYYLSGGSTLVGTVRDDTGTIQVNRSDPSGPWDVGALGVLGIRLDAGTLTVYSDRGGFGSLTSDYSTHPNIGYGTADQPRLCIASGKTGSVAGGLEFDLYSQFVTHDALTSGEADAMSTFLKALAI